MSAEISLIAYAKLNLYLDIVGRREDGYHLLETVMQSVSDADIITVSLREHGHNITVSCSNPLIPVNEHNICYKAAGLFFEKLGRASGADIAIEKRIPSGAGMGGGSADAAAVLMGLNKLCGEPLRMSELSELAERVGADVPFCLVGGTKICRGIGGDISDTSPITDCSFLVVMPDFTISTAEAYSRWDKKPLPSKNGLEGFLAAGGNFGAAMYNVFEELYCDERIIAVKKKLMEGGAVGSALTGSGAAVFGVFSDDNAAAAAARQFPTLFTSICKPCVCGITAVEQDRQIKS